MDDKHPSSSWDDLIKEIGAAPPPDALERKRPAIETPLESAPKVAPPAPVRPKPGDWNMLASELGLSPPPPEPPAAPRSRDLPERASASSAARDLEAGFASIEPIESVFEDMDEELVDVDFADADDSDLADDDEDSDLEDDDDSDLDDESDLVDEGEDDQEPPSLSGEAARSAFEALFQAGSFSAARTFSEPSRPRETPARTDDEGPRRRETTRPERSRQDDRPPRQPRGGRPRNDQNEPAERREPAARDENRDRAPESDAPADSGDRPRRRRRRGRGRGRGGAVRSAEAGDQKATPRDDVREDQWSDSAEPDADERDRLDADREPSREGVADDKPPRRRRSRRGRGGRGRSNGAEAAPASARQPARTQRDDDDDEDEDDDILDQDVGMLAGGGDDEEEDDEGGPKGGSHKTIPSWADALGVLVDVNMQARKNSPQRSGPSGGRSRGRGRGRGRGGERGSGERGGSDRNGGRSERGGGRGDRGGEGRPPRS